MAHNNPKNSPGIDHDFKITLINAMLALVISIVTTLTYNSCESNKQKESITQAFYFEIMRNYQSLWEYVSSIPKEVLLDPTIYVDSCPHIDKAIFESNADRLSILSPKFNHAIFEFYGTINRINFYCEYSKYDQKNKWKNDFKDEKEYIYDSITFSIKEGTILLRHLEKQLSFDPFYTKDRKNHIVKLRNKAFELSPSLKNELEKPSYFF